jgi:hypothetical protein
MNIPNSLVYFSFGALACALFGRPAKRRKIKPIRKMRENVDLMKRAKEKKEI